MQQPATTLFLVAGIYLCFVCQQLDRPRMWSGFEMTASSVTARASMEETMELFAYLLIAFSGIEAVAFANSTRCNAPAHQGLRAGRP